MVADDGVRAQLAAIREQFESLLLPYEVIGIADGGVEASPESLERFMQEHAELRIVRFDRPVGVSVALSAGLRAARGRIIIAVEAGASYAMDEIPAMQKILEASQ